MTHVALKTFLAHSRSALKGPVAVVLAEDTVELESTITRLQGLGFVDILAIGDVAGLQSGKGLHAIEADLDTPEDSLDALNQVIAACTGRWIAYCFNAEYLFFPHCETRSIRDVVTFMEEERRVSVFTYAIDLYPQNLDAHRAGVDIGSAQLDRSGYYGLERHDGPEVLERQFDIFGGLRWRFEEHVPWDKRRIDRISMFKAAKNLKMGPDWRLNDAEMNTISCEWHHNLTMAIMSFRVAKTLMHNPGSAEAIDTFTWGGSTAFDWSSQQLLELGFIETGQWF